MNNHPITDEAATLGAADMHDKAVKLSVGKKKHALVRVED
jgi:tyrosyl-tRNA synthetase